MSTRKYTIFLVDHDPIEFTSSMDCKTKLWDAKKCSYPSFEVKDSEGISYVFSTDHVVAMTTAGAVGGEEGFGSLEAVGVEGDSGK